MGPPGGIVSGGGGGLNRRQGGGGQVTNTGIPRYSSEVLANIDLLLSSKITLQLYVKFVVVLPWCRFLH